MISDIGYALAGLSYLILLLLLFTVKKAGLAKYLLILAAMVTLSWSAAHVSVLSGELTLNRLLFIDTGKQVVWLLFLAAFLRNDFRNIWNVLTRPVTWAILALPLAALLLPMMMPMSATWRFLLQTIIALEVLVLLEQVYRQSGEQRWNFKPLVLYLGALNLFEFVTYANATMVTQVEPLYIAARGYIYMALVPLLIIATRRIKHWGIDIFISREVVLHSSLLLVAGAYLLLMAMLGYAVKYFGGSWGATIQVVLIALSVALLATVFLSHSFRNRLKVFITKNFFANQFDYRLEWVKLTKALSVNCQSLTDVYQAALKGYLGATNYSNGALLKRSQHSFSVVARQHLQTNFSPSLQAKLLQFFKQTQWIFDAEEYRVKPYNYEGLKLTDEELNQVEQMIIVPIGEGESLWGVVVLYCQGDGLLRLNWELRDYLNAVTAQTGDFILHYEAATQVAENAQFAAFSRMSAFVVHDLKNVLAQIDLILCNAQQHKNNPEFIDDTFETLEHTKSRMDKMLAQLTEKQHTTSRNKGSHQLSDIIADVIRKRCANLLPSPVLKVESEQAVVVDSDKFANVMYHLISNAQQATADDGVIELCLIHDQAQQLQTLSIRDNGEGMTDAFIRERLFKPFETTKGNAGMGIGVYDARNYLESIGGSLTVESEVGQGTVFTLSVPTN
ncbi:PEP-CTERM system histidine kinase PrsK [Alteromonas sp. ASW11-36]|uniref:histidine kinase n=1 Tax=Alteromonas arenosi TaxID=3055817 RepID=A0ABT7SVD8_9ALTE|nr:XrtA/PEP-CTERM system histidine kinase PrsK [Alteromonas sp. ASW11-36]MDM7859514.1 PEP-CTERM system histidine kinase PrsK [Alteromonas sp. ASW11-36]